jgi:hypothetical protein
LKEVLDLLEIEKRIFIYKIKQIHFSRQVDDLDGCDCLKYTCIKDYVEKDSFTCEKKLTTVLDLTQDIDLLWKNIGKNNRNKIRNAEREGIKIKKGERYEDFYKMYRSFGRNKSLLPRIGVGLASLQAIKNHGTLFIAEYQNELLIGDVLLENEEAMYWWLSSSKRLQANQDEARLIGRAHRMLIWEVVKYAKKNGIKEFDLGGLWSDEEVKRDEKRRGLNLFKLGFGGNVVERYDYWKYYSKPIRLLAGLYSKLLQS